MNKGFTIFFSIIIYSILLIHSSCTQPGDVPSYLQFSNFAMRTNNNTQGSNSSNYTDVWVTVDGNAQGVYQFPAQFPVLSPCTHTLSLRAGIMLNGIEASRAPYAVTVPFDTTINMPSGKITSFIPYTTYGPNTTFAQIEDFDHPGITFEPSPGQTDTTLIIDTSAADAFEGKFGAVFLDATRPLFQYESVDSFALPGEGAPCYVEVNYLCNNEFTVGTINYNDQGITITPILNVRVTDTWKKIYVNLTPTVTAGNNPLLPHNFWKIYLYALLNPGQQTGYVYFDNIKVVY